MARDSAATVNTPYRDSSSRPGPRPIPGASGASGASGTASASGTDASPDVVQPHFQYGQDDPARRHDRRAPAGALGQRHESGGRDRAGGPEQIRDEDHSPVVRLLTARELDHTDH